MLRFVAPSGAARATASVPMMVPAPGRVSTTIVGPLARRIASPNNRINTSELPPAGLGTTTLTIRGVCDHAAGLRKPAESMVSAAARAASCRN